MCGLAATIAAVLAATAATAAPLRGTSLSPTAYRAKASSICRTTYAKAKALPQPTRTRASWIRYYKRFLSVGRSELSQLRALDPPASLRANHRRVTRIIAAEIDLIHTMLVKIQRGGDPLAVFRANSARGTKLDGEENAVWRKLGVSACAQG